MNLDTNFLSNINRSFKALNTLVGSDAADSITTAMLGQDLIDAISVNFNKSAIEAPASIASLMIGMTGAQVLAVLNNNFISKGQSVYSTNPGVLSILNNIQNIWGFYDAYDLTTITKDESDAVTKWKDILGSGNDFITGSCTWNVSNGMTFDGISQFLKTAQDTSLIQPLMIYMLVRQKTWTEGNVIFDGFTNNTAKLLQSGGVENNLIRVNAGIWSDVLTSLSLEEWSVVRVLFNGPNSFIKINDDINVNGTNITISGDFGANNALGFTIGSAATGESAFSDIDIQGIMLCTAVLSATDEENINKYFKSKYMSKYSFNNGKFIFGWDGDVLTYIKTGHDILQNYNIKDTLFLCADNISEDGWSIVATMATNGTEIQEHGYQHLMFNKLNEAELISNIENMDNAITVRGYPLPTQLAYPYGYNNALAREVVSRYKETARGVREVQLHGTVVNKYDLPGISLGGNTNGTEGLAKLQYQIQKAAENKSALIIYCHGVDEISGGTNAAGLTALCELLAPYLSSGQIDSINHSELAALLT